MCFEVFQVPDSDLLAYSPWWSVQSWLYRSFQKSAAPKRREPIVIMIIISTCKGPQANGFPPNLKLSGLFFFLI